MKVYFKIVLLALSTAFLSGCSRNSFERSGEMENIQPFEVASSDLKKSSKVEEAFLNLGWLLEKNEGDISSDLSDEERDIYIKKGLQFYESRTVSSELDEESKLNAYKTLTLYHISKHDYRSALNWAFLGVEAGSNACAEGLYYFYISGMGVVQDYEEATKWLYVASALGNERCQSILLGRVEKSSKNPILAQRLEEGRLRAKLWEHNHPKLFYGSRIFEWSTSPTKERE